MRPRDAHALGDLAGEALAAGGILVEEMHEGIARRAFGALSPSATPVRVIHDGIARAVYAGVRSGLRGVARSSGRVAALWGHAEAPPLASDPRGSLALGALNGLYGDRLARRASDLALGMEMRRHGAAVAPTEAALAAAFPDATPRVAVFVHGLCESDDAWRQFYGERLRQELGFTPVYLRYNSGLHVSDNGRALAGLLGELTSAWPAGVDELALVGHSMGGLVARSACHYGELAGRPWTGAVRHVFCLGTPHLGADIEKGVNLLAWGLGRLPETRAFARLVNARSAGIKDLRFGSCVEDWSDCDPDEFLRDRCQEVPFLTNANYYFIGARLSPGPLGALLGDLLVRSPSSSGRGTAGGRRIPFEVANGRELVGLTHFALLDHPDVYEQLRAWIDG